VHDGVVKSGELAWPADFERTDVADMLERLA
jgi:hypothetical protein